MSRFNRQVQIAVADDPVFLANDHLLPHVIDSDWKVRLLISHMMTCLALATAAMAAPAMAMMPMIVPRTRCLLLAL